jgi:hypothetical protein
MKKITIPSSNVLAERIKACRDELAALRRIQRLARAAESAQLVHERRAKESKDVEEELAQVIAGLGARFL